MYHPIEYEMEARRHYAELLEEAAQARLARQARGGTRSPAPGWRVIAVSLAVAAGLILFAAGTGSVWAVQASR